MEKKKIAFVCVHNSCRSQIAEALGNHLRGNDFECYSCGTETKQQINPVSYTHLTLPTNSLV